MKFEMKRFCCVLALVLTCVALRAAEEPAKFVTKPTATRVSDKVKIDFAASHETDAAVYIIDSKDNVVRHLVAGVLGKNAPEPFKAGLAQSVEWDGKDDAGKAASGGPFKVRVALGMKPEFDSFILNNPDGCGRVRALACGPGGSVYVFHSESTANDNMGGYKIKIYNRDGKHQKALTPFAADVPAEKLKATGVFQTKEGDLVPHVYNWETFNFYPDAVGSRGRDMPDAGSIPTVDSKGRVYWMIRGPAICAVDADGGIPYDTFIGPKLLTDIKGLRMAGEPYEFNTEKPALAVSSDDKYVYFAGLAGPSGALPCVFRVDAAKRAPAEVFLGKLGAPGKEKDALQAPRGMAVAKGLIYVADPDADRIAVFKEADRSFAGEIKVKAPHCVGVDPASGAVYVCSQPPKENPALIKFSGLEGAKELYRLAMPGSPVAGQVRIAVDASAKPVRIWMPEVMYAGWAFQCFEDSGDKFVNKGDPRSKDPWIEGPRDLSIDRTRNELYVKGNYAKDLDGRKHWRFDEKTCAVLKEPYAGTAAAASGTQLVPGPDGNLYTLSFGGGLMRYDHDFKPLNFEGLKSNQINVGGTMCFQERQLSFKPYSPADELYLVCPPYYRFILEDGVKLDDAGSKCKQKGRYTCLNVLSQDAKTKRTVIWQCLDSAVARLDAKGNIYVADGVHPADRSYPEFFDGKLPEKGGSDSYWTGCMYASIIKFPPSGGAIWYTQKKLADSCVGQPPAELLAKPAIPFKSFYNSGYDEKPAGIQGALWMRFGYSPFSIPGSGGGCNCEGNGFDVDPFGRVFFPNMCQYRVEVIDTNNNAITTFGKYGNEDSGGKDAKVKKPEIPLAWPTYVAVSDKYAYVADTVNRRVVRVKLNYTAEETCPAP
jgi:DNA-binding beta-propeller fold protein YncE